MSSTYLRSLIFLQAILIPACASSSLAFCMRYSAYKLDKQSDNIQHWRIHFPIWNQSVVPRLVLTVASWPENRFLRRQVKVAGILISLRIFHHLGEQDGGGEGGSGVHLSPQIHQEYTFRHRSAWRTQAESWQEYLTCGKEYIEPCETQ